MGLSLCAEKNGKVGGFFIKRRHIEIPNKSDSVDKRLLCPVSVLQGGLQGDGSLLILSLADLLHVDFRLGFVLVHVEPSIEEA